MVIKRLNDPGNHGGMSIIFLLMALSFVRCALQTSCIELKIMSLNVWGLPEKFGSKFKEERIDAIAREVLRGHFDVYLLQELWMEQDHDKIAASLPKGYYMTGFRQFAVTSGRFLDTCDGIFSPVECSGLAIISKYPFKEVQFKAYSDRGNEAKMLIDGEALVGKGAGRVTIEPIPNLTVDIFSTHVAADPETYYGYNNDVYREKQISQLMNKWVPRATSDIVLLGGDFNITPEPGKSSVYQMIRRKMNNSGEEMYPRMDRWQKEDFATYANPSNTFNGDSDYKPIILDYIFWRVNDTKKVKVGVHSFHLPLYKTNLSNQRQGLQSIKKYLINKIKNHFHRKAEAVGSFGGASFLLEEARKKRKGTNDMDRKFGAYGSDDSKISLSDHEAIASTLSICLLK